MAISERLCTLSTSIWSCFGLLLVMIIMRLSICVESRSIPDDTITVKNIFDPTNLGEWDPSLKTNCQKFHPQTSTGHDAHSIFFNWPEPKFQYCCSYEYEGESLTNYTYTKTGPKLQTTTYYDIGLVDKCMPYWKCSAASKWIVFRQSVTFNITCERTDMEGFYSRRLWIAIFLYGLIESALPLLLILELAVFLVICTLSACQLCNTTTTTDSKNWSHKPLFRFSRKYRSYSTIIHLCLLVVVGNCFMEAAGHSDPYGWEADMSFKCARFYVAAPIILCVAMFFQQLAVWRSMTLQTTSSAKVSSSAAADIDTTPHEQQETATETTCAGESAAAADMVKKSLHVSEDWKWQPVLGQLAVLLLIAAYCMFSGPDGERATYISFLLSVAVVACGWSVLSACSVLFRSCKLLVSPKTKVSCTCCPLHVAITNTDSHV